MLAMFDVKKKGQEKSHGDVNQQSSIPAVFVYMGW